MWGVCEEEQWQIRLGEEMGLGGKGLEYHLGKLGQYPEVRANLIAQLN